MGARVVVNKIYIYICVQTEEMIDSPVRIFKLDLSPTRFEPGGLFG